MQALAVVGYIVMAIGIALFVLTVVKKLVSGEPSKIKAPGGVEISISETLLLAVVGAAMAVAGTLGPTWVAQKGEESPGTSTPQPPPPTTSSSAAPSATTEAPSPSLTINEPLPEMLVPGDGFPVSGTSNLQVTDSLWVVYRGINNSNPSFQPQNRPCSIAVGGAFTCPPQYVGGPEDGGKGLKFELLFLLADPSASKVFLDYEASNPAERGYPGLTVLPPEGLQQIGSVTVQRR